MKKITLLTTVLTLISYNLSAQWEYREMIKHDNVTYPKTSKGASVSQTIGITDITINYHRPGVKNRMVWGGLIPYNRVWRAGAEESTTIRFMDDVTVNGNKLKAGTYGIHMIPGEKEWTIIFSNNHTQWGSFFYKEEEDALRIKVKPFETDFEEYLRYNFENLKPNSVEVQMSWARLGVSFEVKVDMIETTLAVMRDELRTLPRFTWRGSREAALWCWYKETNLEEALSWINLSIRYEERQENVIVKSLILKSLDRESESEEVLNKAKSMGEADDMVIIGIEAMGHHNTLHKAIEVFELTLRHYPKSYSAYRYMGMAYGWQRKPKKAKEAFEKALKFSSNDEERNAVQNQMRIFRL